MTPQEQIEEQYGHEKLIGVCRVSGDWIEVQSTDEPCPHLGCDCGLAFFRSIRFDSPQISEGMVEAGARVLDPWAFDAPNQDAYAGARDRATVRSRAILSAALTQPQSEEPGPYAKAFSERVCPVPEFPGIKNRQEDQA